MSNIYNGEVKPSTPQLPNLYEIFLYPFLKKHEPICPVTPVSNQNKR